MKLTSITIILAGLSIGLVYQNSYAVEWKTFTSEKYGISLQVPETWTIEEKQNRFDSGSDIYISDPAKDSLQSFAIDVKVDRSLMEELGFLQWVKQATLPITTNPSVSIIEPISNEKYKIDGYETGSFVYGRDLFGITVGVQSVIVNGPLKLYDMVYTNSGELFDSSESQEILDHMLNSIKLVD